MIKVKEILHEKKRFFMIKESILGSASKTEKLHQIKLKVDINGTPQSTMV